MSRRDDIEEMAAQLRSGGGGGLVGRGGGSGEPGGGVRPGEVCGGWARSYSPFKVVLVCLAVIVPPVALVTYIFFHRPFLARTKNMT